MNLLEVNDIIRRARASGTVLFVQDGTVFGYPINKLPQSIRTEIRTHHDRIRELLILAAI